MENWTNLDKGREGVKNPGNFVDIICTWPLTRLLRARLRDKDRGGGRDGVVLRPREWIILSDGLEGRARLEAAAERGEGAATCSGLFNLLIQFIY